MTKSSFTKNLIYLVLLVPTSLLFNSCDKEALDGASGITATNSIQLHGLGLNSMTPDQYADVAVFPSNLYAARPDGLSPEGGTIPSSYLLTTPAIRDQGQIGACTGFCGTETNEILNYYKGVNPASPSITVADAVATAMNNKFISPTSFFGTDGALAPLFLYYVERCVIEKQKISSDPGANMVNIGEVFQGLSSNAGKGTALTLNGVTYKGESTEDLYPYPTTVINAANPYNLATSTSPGFQVVPSLAAVTNATNFILAAQTGSTTATGTTTTNGYYTITSSGDSTEVANCKIAISNNKPVMMGFNVYDNSAYTIFEGLSTTSYTYNPLIAKTTTTTKNGKKTTTTTYVLNTKLSLLGGHAVPLIGYVNDGTLSTSATGGGYFVCQNSWGTPWGNNGYFLLPYSVLMNTSVVSSGSLYVAIL